MDREGGVPDRARRRAPRPGRWALFAMREDFIAQLDPYLALVPNRFAIRYRSTCSGRMRRRSRSRQTAADAGVDFTSEAAALLVDDLRRVQGAARAAVTTSSSPDRARTGAAAGRLPAALGDAASRTRTRSARRRRRARQRRQRARRLLRLPGPRRGRTHRVANEREIRSWFGEALITENGFRTQVVRGPQTNGGAVVRELENADLIRTEQRRGTEWYELAHDRLIEPIRANNAAWGQHALGSLQREAQQWEHRGPALGTPDDRPTSGRSRGLGRQHASEMLPVDRDFLDAGRAEQRRIDLEQRATRLKLVAMTTISASRSRRSRSSYCSSPRPVTASVTRSEASRRPNASRR